MNPEHINIPHKSPRAVEETSATDADVSKIDGSTQAQPTAIQACGPKTANGLLQIPQCRFTVLTPTYNRAHLLERLYRSLCTQTFNDFEWIIVDEGSTDYTKTLVTKWMCRFPMRYVPKPNGGKHTAVNLGVQEAVGEWILIVDSDDWLLPSALERFDSWIRQLSPGGPFCCCGSSLQR